VQTVFEALGGKSGVFRLAEAWHRRVMDDEVVSHAFSHGFDPHHTERLAAYWSEALGGPADYSANYGDETSVRRLHSGNGEHSEMDMRAIECFDHAMDDVGLTSNPELRRVLHDYFASSTRTFAQYQLSPNEVPDGLEIPRWSWNSPPT
jgi:hemoglobin